MVVVVADPAVAAAFPLMAALEEAAVEVLGAWWLKNSKFVAIFS
jgi:hypothetical protein